MIRDDHYVICDNDDGERFGRCLVLKASWSTGLLDVIKSEKIKVLRLSHLMGWKDADLSFLAELKSAGLTGVYIYSWDVKDLTPLRFVPDIDYLGVSALFTKVPDFSKFRNLKRLALSWRPKATGLIEGRDLEYFNVDRYPYEDLTPVAHMLSMEELHIQSRKLTSLTGIDNFQNLRRLTLAYCPFLVDFEPLRQCKNLEYIEVYSCKKISHIDFVTGMPKLETLHLENCGSIKTIEPLGACKNLKAFYAIDCKIEDGDLSVLKDMQHLENVSFRVWKHYSHDRDDFPSKKFD